MESKGEGLACEEAIISGESIEQHFSITRPSHSETKSTDRSYFILRNKPPTCQLRFISSLSVFLLLVGYERDAKFELASCHSGGRGENDLIAEVEFFQVGSWYYYKKRKFTQIILSISLSTLIFRIEMWL